MKFNLFLYPLMVSFLLIGCVLPQVIQPMRLYDLRSGNTIEVFLQPTSRDHGLLKSRSRQQEHFEGEYVLLDRYAGMSSPPRPRPLGEPQSFRDSIPNDFAELYGFSKNSSAQPVGTGILVGKDSTVIQIVFYHVSADNQTGDGVAKDNKGRYYRVYFSTEGE